MKTMHEGQEVTWESTGESAQSDDQRYYCQWMDGYVDGELKYQAVGHYLHGPDSLEEITDIEEHTSLQESGRALQKSDLVHGFDFLYYDHDDEVFKQTRVIEVNTNTDPANVTLEDIDPTSTWQGQQWEEYITDILNDEKTAKTE